MSQSVTTQWRYLERDPLSSYRQLSIKGRRIKARTLYGAYMSEEEPRSIEQIAEDWDLPIEVVKEAIAYCETDPPEIRLDYAIEQATMDALGMNDSNYKYNPQPKRIPPQKLCRIRDETEEKFWREENARKS